LLLSSSLRNQASSSASLWAQVVTGLEMDGDGFIHELEVADWSQRRQRFEQEGGLAGP
jgi:hypothetical protein